MKTSPLIALLAAVALTPMARAETFVLTVTNHGPQPLSPVFFSASLPEWDIFDIGSKASPGIKDLAEAGDPSTMSRLAALSRGSAFTFGTLGDTPQRTLETRSVTFETDGLHDHFSFAAMLGKTNDGFIGESTATSDLLLFQKGVAVGWTLEVYGARAWDAGTESNTQNGIDLAFLGGQGNPLEYGVVQFHQGIEAGLGDSWRMMPEWDATTHLATVELRVAPEPASLLMLGTALAVLASKRRGAKKPELDG